MNWELANLRQSQIDFRIPVYFAIERNVADNISWVLLFQEHQDGFKGVSHDLACYLSAKGRGAFTGDMQSPKSVRLIVCLGSDRSIATAIHQQILSPCAVAAMRRAPVLLPLSDVSLEDSDEDTDVVLCSPRG